MINYIRLNSGKISVLVRLAAIDGIGDTVTSLTHRGTVPHRRLDLYSNKNNLVQLEDTIIKTERCCSTQRTEWTRVVHHSSLGPRD